MNTIKKMFVKVVRSVREFTLVGAIVGASSLMAGATETVEKAAPTVERLETVKLTTVKHNLEAVVAALTVIDPAWIKNLPKAKASKKSQAKRQGTQCYLFMYDFPTPTQSTITESYELEEGNVPCGDAFTLCKICLDPSFFVLDDEGRPDFDHPANSALKALIQSISQDPDNDGQTFTANGTNVTVYFRPAN